MNYYNHNSNNFVMPILSIYNVIKFAIINKNSIYFKVRQ